MLRRRRATTAQAQWGVIVFNPLLEFNLLVKNTHFGAIFVFAGNPLSWDILCGR
jgi:hypothetical protein